MRNTPLEEYIADEFSLAGACLEKETIIQLIERSEKLETLKLKLTDGFNFQAVIDHFARNWSVAVVDEIFMVKKL